MEGGSEAVRMWQLPNYPAKNSAVFYILSEELLETVEQDVDDSWTHFLLLLQVRRRNDLIQGLALDA